MSDDRQITECAFIAAAKALNLPYTLRLGEGGAIEVCAVVPSNTDQAIKPELNPEFYIYPPEGRFTTYRLSRLIVLPGRFIGPPED